MKAKVQYGDYKGTAAADISDFWINSMDEYLHHKSGKYDKSRYHCVGCGLTPYGDNKLDIEFYCRDLKTRELVSMRFSHEFPLSELFIIFKRFNIVIGEGIEHEDDPQGDSIYLD